MVTHHHRRRKLREIDGVRQLFGPSKYDTFGGREMRRVRVCRPVIYKGHLPIHSGREIDDRRCVRARSQKQQFGGQAEWQDEQFPER